MCMVAPREFFFKAMSIKSHSKRTSNSSGLHPIVNVTLQLQKSHPYSWYDGDRNKLKVQSWLPSRQNSLQTSPRTRYKMACRSLSLRLVLISCDRAQKSCRILHDSTTILNSIFFCVCERPKRAILNRFFAVFMLARKKCPVCLNDYNCLKFACMKKRICHPHQALQVNRLLWMILMRNK